MEDKLKQNNLKKIKMNDLIDTQYCSAGSRKKEGERR
jgi:hypothetical protein